MKIDVSDSIIEDLRSENRELRRMLQNFHKYCDKMENRLLEGALGAKRVGNYEIYGNKYVAIAINVLDPKDSHYFTIDPEANNDAFVRACGWAYEPENLPSAFEE